MARLNRRLEVDTSGMQPLMASVRSLAEALDIAQPSREIELEGTSGGLEFEGKQIAAIAVARLENFKGWLVATPTFWMPWFATEVCRLAPGVKVRWNAGWPHFSASDCDPEPADPVPANPESLVLS